MCFICGERQFLLTQYEPSKPKDWTNHAFRLLLPSSVNLLDLGIIFPSCRICLVEQHIIP